MNIAIEQYRDRIDDLIGRGAHIPALPMQGAELIRLTNIPLDTIDIRKVIGLIESEPTLTAMLLKLANSSRYGTSRQIRRIDHALFIVGLAEALDMLQYYLVRNMFPRWLNLPHFTVEDYWYHSWICAQTAQFLGQPRFLVQSLPGELYIAGLLHDIGKAIMAAYLPEQASCCVALATEVGIPDHVAERQVVGLDHGVLAAVLLNRWMLPPAILDAVGCHHDPGLAEPKHRELVALVQLADAITTCIQKDLDEEAIRQKISETWIWVRGGSPLSREDILWPVMDEIRQRVIKKGVRPENLDGAETDPPENAADKRERERSSGVRALASNPRTPTRKTMWLRAAAWLAGIFH